MTGLGNVVVGPLYIEDAGLFVPLGKLDKWDQVHYGLLTSKKIGYSEYQFWMNITKDGPVHLIHGQCWMWCSHRDRKGYGITAKKRGFAHRRMYNLVYGKFDDDLFVLHKCDNPSCVNPEHLFLGTMGDNISDKMSKGRQVKGERQGGSKLTKADIIDIRTSCRGGESWSSVARRHHIHKRHVGRIMSKYAWKHVE
jgi:hypothetical protein